MPNKSRTVTCVNNPLYHISQQNQKAKNVFENINIVLETQPSLKTHNLDLYGKILQNIAKL